MESLSEILKKYGAIDLSMDIEGIRKGIYFLPMKRKDFHYLYKMTFGELGQLMHNEKINSIIFADDNNNFSELNMDSDSDSCRLESYPKECFVLKKPEDWFKIRDILHPEDAMPGIYH